MFTEALVNFAVDTISILGYWGIFILMTAESMLVPFPSEIIMTFSGFLASTGHFNFYLVVLVGAIGNTLGATIAFFFGHHFKKLVIKKAVEKYGKFIFISESEFERAEEIFKKHGPWVITASRLIPGIRAVISVPAGASHMPYSRFVIFTFIGSAIWSFALAYAGTILGSNWEKVKIVFYKFDLLIILFAAFLIGFYFFKKLRHKSK